MNAQKREKLLAVSTSGKNSAKGFMGKVRSAFEAAIGAIETGYADAMNAGLVEIFSEWRKER